MNRRGKKAGIPAAAMDIFSIILLLLIIIVFIFIFKLSGPQDPPQVKQSIMKAYVKISMNTFLKSPINTDDGIKSVADILVNPTLRTKHLAEIKKIIEDYFSSRRSPDGEHTFRAVDIEIDGDDLYDFSFDEREYAGGTGGTYYLPTFIPSEMVELKYSLEWTKGGVSSAWLIAQQP